MQIKLTFAYFPVRNEDGKHNGDFEVSRLDNSSVDGVHTGCEACAAFVAERVVAAAQKALEEYKAQAAQQPVPQEPSGE